MSRIRLVVIGTVLMFALSVAAQGVRHRSGDGVPTAQEQMKLLTARLDLSAGQQSKIKSIMDDLHDATEKLVRDESLSREQRMDQVRILRMKTDKRIREVLNEDQKKKLDRLEQEPHPEMHGNVDPR